MWHCLLEEVRKIRGQSFTAGYHGSHFLKCVGRIQFCAQHHPQQGRNQNNTRNPMGLKETNQFRCVLCHFVRDNHQWNAGQQWGKYFGNRIQKTERSFLDSVAEIFAPLLASVPLMIVPDEMAKDAAELIRFLETHGVTRIVLVPSLLRMMLSAELDAAHALQKMRTVVTSGEALPPDLANLFKEAMPHAALLNFYGSSEVAADATWCDLTQRRASDP